MECGDNIGKERVLIESFGEIRPKRCRFKVKTEEPGDRVAPAHF